MKRPVLTTLIGLVVPLLLFTLPGTAGAQLPPLPAVTPCPTETPSDAVRPAGPAKHRAALPLPPDDEAPDCVDLTITNVDSPNPVNHGGDVVYTTVLTNNGPGDAYYPYVYFESSGQIQGADASGDWGCWLDTYYGYCSPQYEGSYLEAGGSVTAKFIVQAPGEGSDFMGDAYAYSYTYDTNYDDNEAYETTTLSSDAGDSAAAIIPPGGGSVSTCPGAGTTTSDDTCGTLTFPFGPGGVAQIVEHPEGLTPCAILAPACLGWAIDYIVPDGYTRRARPIVANIEYDITLLTKGPFYLFFQKGISGIDIPVSLPVPKCYAPEILLLKLPCWTSRARVNDGDLRWAFSMLSGDPKFQGIMPSAIGL